MSIWGAPASAPGRANGYILPFFPNRNMEEGMRTRRPALWLLCLLVASLGRPAAGLARPDPTPAPMLTIRGRWHIDFNRKDSFLRLTRDPGAGQGARGPEATRFRLEDCLGLLRPSGAAKKPVRFKIARDAGDFEFEGQANESEGDGRFVFSADDDFEGNPNLEQLWGMALYDVSVEFLRNLQSIGFRQKPTHDQLIAMRMYGVDADFILGLKSLGYTDIPIQDVILLRKNGGTLEYARKMKAERPGLSIQELARAKAPAK